MFLWSVSDSTVFIFIISIELLRRFKIMTKALTTSKWDPSSENNKPNSITISVNELNEHEINQLKTRQFQWLHMVRVVYSKNECRCVFFDRVQRTDTFRIGIATLFLILRPSWKNRIYFWSAFLLCLFCSARKWSLNSSCAMVWWPF